MCNSCCLEVLVKRVRPHAGRAATRVGFLGDGDQDGGNIFAEFVCEGGVQ